MNTSQHIFTFYR